MRTNSQPDQEIDLHSGVDPAEIYFGEPTYAKIFILKSGHTFDNLQVFRVSPFGVEINIENAAAEQLSIGEKIDVEVNFGNQKTSFRGLMVGTLKNTTKGILIGIRWFGETQTSAQDAERRAGKRWAFSDTFLPSGVAPNSLRFNDYIYFKVRDISANGFLMETSLRNKFLIKGVSLNCKINFPLIGDTNVTVQIRNARIINISDKQVLLVGCQFVKPSRAFKQIVSDYTVQFSNEYHSDNVQENGLAPKSVSNGLTFGFVKNEEEYHEVLKLRHAAYSQVGKMDKSASYESAGDIYDSRARILYARHNGRMVGSIRLMFHSSDDQFEHEEFVKFPDSFPPKEQIVEMTRLCTDPNYRGMDLFYSICARAALAIVQSDRKFMLGSSVKKLMPIYEKIGWKPTGVFYSHAALGNESHEIVMCNMRECVSGKGISYAAWKNVYSEVFDFLIENGQLNISPINNGRVFLYETISRIFG
jgi:predicted GNAT family N-acyltransferase